MLISLATPFFLKKIGELKAYHMGLSVIALVLLIVPIVGTVYPVPPFPQNMFPYIFGTYMVTGAVVVFVRSRTKAEIAAIRQVLDESNAAFSAGSAPAPALA